VVSSGEKSPARLSAWSPPIERLVEHLRQIETAAARAKLTGDALGLLEAKKARRRILGRIEQAKSGAMADDRGLAPVA
jgi:hypothetical protein